MKTKRVITLTAGIKLLIFMPVIIIVLFTVTSCASAKKTPQVKTVIVAPPPPPPPPPPPSSKQKPGAIKGDQKVVIEENTDEETPFVVVEEMPVFPGGDSLLLAYIAQNTKYPEQAKINGIQGRVIARFCVNKTGGVDRISILKGVSPELDAEALRVVSTLPEFKPGKQGGKPVSVWYMVPITFALGENKTITPPPATEIVYTEVDKMPEYKDGDMGLLKFIAENTKYPDQAKKDKITGRVLVKFIVEKDCSVSNVAILEGVNPLLDNEALRVVATLPKFESPGIKAGVPVRVNYVIPITFALK